MRWNLTTCEVVDTYLLTCVAWAEAVALVVMLARDPLVSDIRYAAGYAQQQQRKLTLCRGI